MYQQTDYRKALREILDEKKRVDPSINFASYAEVIGVQKTFVSKVLGGNAHLSDDQFYLTLIFLALDERDASYFRLLYDYARTGLHTRKKALLAEIKARQEEKRQLKLHTTSEVQMPESPSAELGEYYLDPLNLIVHAYLSIPKFAAHPMSIVESLDINPSKLIKVLENLRSMNIVSFQKPGSKVTVLRYALHLDVNSIYCKPHQQLFRMKSAEQIAKLDPEHRFVYSLTFSADHEIKGQIQELYLDYMKKVEKLLDSKVSAEDVVYQINFDLFPWVKGSKN